MLYKVCDMLKSGLVVGEVFSTDGQIESWGLGVEAKRDSLKLSVRSRGLKDYERHLVLAPGEEFKEVEQLVGIWKAMHSALYAYEAFGAPYAGLLGHKFYVPYSDKLTAEFDKQYKVKRDRQAFQNWASETDSSSALKTEDILENGHKVGETYQLKCGIRAEVMRFEITFYRSNCALILQSRFVGALEEALET